MEKNLDTVLGIIRSGGSVNQTALNCYNFTIWIASFYIYVAAYTATSVDANIGTDFIPPIVFHFDPGMAEACSAVTIIDDDTIEDTETFTMTINTGQDHVVVGSPNVVTVSIIDSTCKFYFWYIIQEINVALVTLYIDKRH